MFKQPMFLKKNKKFRNSLFFSRQMNIFNVSLEHIFLREDKEMEKYQKPTVVVDEINIEDIILLSVKDEGKFGEGDGEIW